MTDSCLDYASPLLFSLRSGDEKFDLAPVDEFFEKAPDTIAKPVRFSIVEIERVVDSSWPSE